MEDKLKEIIEKLTEDTDNDIIFWEVSANRYYSRQFELVTDHGASNDNLSYNSNTISKSSNNKDECKYLNTLRKACEKQYIRMSEKNKSKKIEDAWQDLFNKN